MNVPNVRRLAALDMWGTRGGQRRRKLIRAEFLVGAAGCGALGILSLATGSGWLRLLGAWLVGAGLNYVPLALEAQSLSKPGALEDELRGVELRRELRRAGAQQFWIAVPLAIVMFALAGRRSHY